MYIFAARTLRWFHRWNAARRIGCQFVRQRTFVAPATIHFGDKTIHFAYPDGQPGISSDFVNLLLDDDYGMNQHASKPVSTIVDIGANIGLFSIWARMTHPTSIIHAYEPNPAAFSFLKSNAEDLKIEVHPVAVGSRNGTVSLAPCSDLTCQQVEFDEKGNTPIISLSAVVDSVGGQIDILKMDCEGYEWDIFQDVKAFRQVRDIRMEYHLVEGRTLDDLRNTAATIGFKIVRLIPNTHFGIVHMTNTSFGSSSL